MISLNPLHLMHHLVTPQLVSQQLDPVLRVAVTGAPGGLRWHDFLCHGACFPPSPLLCVYFPLSRT
jgi:hypothetical protein